MIVDWDHCWREGCGRPCAAPGICRSCWKGLREEEQLAIIWSHRSPLWPDTLAAHAVTGAPGGIVLQHLEMMLATRAAVEALGRRWRAGTWSPGKPRRR